MGSVWKLPPSVQGAFGELSQGGLGRPAGESELLLSIVLGLLRS